MARSLNLFAVNSVICEDIGLTRLSNADLAFCTTESNIQEAENIKIIFENKMSIVSNYKFTPTDSIELIGDYKQHRGNPSLLRSDSMLKAIGKSINIRVSGPKSSRIPIIILGNSPISESYQRKVDFLKTSGVIQGFWSLNPNPTSTNHVTNSPKMGFQTILNKETIYTLCDDLILNDLNYFSSMISKTRLGEIITISNNETNDIAKAEKFLSLINN